jgi:transcriptional regulator with XRE-family HTH domain
MGLFGKKHSIGKTIAELRKAKGWTQIELAEKL